MYRLPLKQRNPQRFNILVSEWSRTAEQFEVATKLDKETGFKKRVPEFGYLVTRVEKDDSMHLNSNYKISPKSVLIPELIKSNPHRKIRIIDLGTGNGEYMDSLRERFGKKTKIYSTGIAKSSVKKLRRDYEMPKLHKNDLKWRSIEELDDNPEFDLIMSSYGELFYGTKPDSSTTDIEKENPYRLATRLKKIMRKLNDGGILCAGPIVHRKAFSRLIAKIAKQQGFDFDIHFKKNNEGTFWNPAYQVLIRKNNSLDFARKAKPR